MSIARITGPNLVLRLIEPEDAAYLYGLRTNPKYNQHLSPVTGTVADQRRWIVCYKQREALGAEFYYVIERHDGVRCGVVRLYDIATDQFTWGSWILDHNKPSKAALESAVLSFGAGFSLEGKRRAVLDVRRDNLHAQTFYRRFGMRETHSDGLNVYFEYPFTVYMGDRDVHLATIMGAGHV